MELNTIHDDDVPHFTTGGEKVISAIFTSQSRLQDNVLPFFYCNQKESAVSFHIIQIMTAEDI